MRQLKFGPLTFLDSVEFVKESLAKIIESHKRGKDDLTVAFPRTVRHHPALRETESILKTLGCLSASCRSHTVPFGIGPLSIVRRYFPSTSMTTA
jgi:hypothetical protein